MKLFLIVLSLITGVLVSRELTTSLFKNENLVTIVNVYDGDTFTASNGKKLRLSGVDTPEIQLSGRHTPSCNDFKLGERIRDGVASLILNKKVKVQRVGTDVYKRTLVKVKIPDGRDLADLEIKNHWAVYWPSQAGQCPVPIGGTLND